MHGLLTGQHTVHIAPDGIDLAVVENKAVGVCPLPAGVGVGREAGVDHGDGGPIILILEVRIEFPQLRDQEHTLVDDGAAGAGDHISIVIGLFKDTAGNVELAVKFQTSLHALRPGDKGLLDIGHAGYRLLPQHLRLDGDGTPAQKGHALTLHNDLEHLFGLTPGQGVLGEEEHANAVIPLLAQVNAQLPGSLGKKAVADLEHDANAVAGLALSVLAGTVFQLFHDLQGVIHGSMGLAALDVHYRADAAGVMLKAGVVKTLLRHGRLCSHFFHFELPLSRKMKSVSRQQFNRAIPVVCPSLDRLPIETLLCGWYLEYDSP